MQDLCRLCVKTKNLCGSHLIGRAIFVIMHRNTADKDPSNTKPVFVSDARTVQTQSQFKDYVLCFDCEQRFSKRGESWVHENCWKSPQKFHLRELLLKTELQLEAIN